MSLLRFFILVIGVVAAGNMVICGPSSAATDPPPTRDASILDDVFIAIADPFSLVSDTSSIILRPLSPPAPGNHPIFARNLKTRPNLNYTPYSSGYKFERLTIKPIAEYYRLWNNNVFNVESGRKEDTLHRAITGFTSSYGLDAKGQNTVRLNYTTTLEYFDRHSNQDHDDHTIGTGGNFSLGSLRLSGDARWARSTSRGNINLPDPVSSSENTNIQALAELPMGAYFAEFDLKNFHTNSLSSANAIFDRNEIALSPRLGLNLTAVDQLFFEYSRLEMDYPNQKERDGSGDQEGIGLRSYLDDKTSVTGLVAFQSRVYEDDERPDFDGVVASLKILRLIAEKHGIMVQAERRVAETTFDGQSFVKITGLNYEYRQPTAAKDVYLINKGGVSYQEYSRISIVAGDAETRRDYVWNEAIGCEYMLLGGSASFYFLYAYNGIMSNTANTDIEVQQITYGFKGYF